MYLFTSSDLFGSNATHLHNVVSLLSFMSEITRDYGAVKCVELTNGFVNMTNSVNPATA